MNQLKNPFGMRDGQIISISELSEGERGLKCNCLCPACGEQFEARMGEMREHHFSHTKDTKCEADKGILVSLYLLLAEYLRTNTLILPVAFISGDYDRFKLHTQNGIDGITEEDFDEFRWNVYSCARNQVDTTDTLIVYRPSNNRWSKLQRSSNFGEPYDECLISNGAFVIDGKVNFWHEYEAGDGLPQVIVTDDSLMNRMYIRIRLYRTCDMIAPKYRKDMADLSVDVPLLNININEAMFDQNSEALPIDKDTILKHLLDPNNMSWEEKSLPVAQLEKGKRTLMRQFLIRRADEIIKQMRNENVSLDGQLEKASRERRLLKEENERLKKQLDNETSQRNSLLAEIDSLKAQLRHKDVNFASSSGETTHTDMNKKDGESESAFSKDFELLKKKYTSIESIPEEFIYLGNQRYIYCLTCEEWRTVNEMKSYRWSKGTKCQCCQK